MRKFLAAFAVLVAVAGLVLYSLPDVRRAAPAADYFASADGLSQVVRDAGAWVRSAPGEASAASVWYLKLSPVDGVYFAGADTGAVSVVAGPATAVRLLSEGAYVVSANDPFASYVVEDADRTFRIKPLQNGIFAVIKGAEGSRIYSFNAILSLTLLDAGRPSTTVDVYPGTLVNYDPRTAPALKDADLLRVTQVNEFSFVDVRDDGYRSSFSGSDTVRQKTAPDFVERVFTNGSRAFVKAVFGDQAAQVAQLRALFSSSKGSGLTVVPGLPDPLSPSPALVNARKQAVALQNLLLRRLNEMAAEPGRYGQSYLTEILDRIAQVGPVFYEESLGLVRKFYTLYWIDGTYAADQDILLAQDGFSEATRGLFGCKMAAPYFSGLSNIFLAYFFHTVLPPADGKIAQMDSGVLDLYLRNYVTLQMPGAVSADKAGGKSRPGACAASAPTGINDANVRSFWLFLVQYLDRARGEATPSANTLRLGGIVLRLGSLYLEAIASRDFEFRKTEYQTMVRYYRNVFPRQVASVEADVFSSKQPFYVFKEDRIRGNELQVDRDVVIELEGLSKSVSALASALMSPVALSGSADYQVRSIRSMVENALRPQVYEPLRYLHCLLTNEREYRFKDDADKPLFCREDAVAQPGAGSVPAGTGASSVGAELKANVAVLTGAVAGTGSADAPRRRPAAKPVPVPPPAK